MSADSVLNQAIGAVLGAVNNYGVGALAADGQSLFAGLALIAFSWMGIRLVLEAGAITDLMGTLMRTMLTIGMVYWAISPEGYNLIFKEGVDGTMNALAAKLSGVAGSPQTALVSTMTKLIEHAVLIGDKIYTTWLQDAGPLDVMAIIAKNFFALLFLSLSIVMIFLAAVVYFAVGITSIIMIQIALILGPIFIPWVLIPMASFMFEGWLKFLVIAGLTKVIGALLIGIASATLTAITIDLSGDFGQTLIMSMAAAAVAMLIAYLMSQIPNIAQSLVSGGAGFSAFQGVRSAQKGSQGVPGTMGEVAGSAGVGAGRGMQAAGGASNSLGNAAQKFGNISGTSSAIEGKDGTKAIAAGNLVSNALTSTGNALKSGGTKLENFSRGGNKGGKSGSGNGNAGGDKTKG